MLSNRKILLGITGGIAAYKAALLTRLLVKQGADVKVIMTPAATAFIAPLTLATLSKNEVHIDLFDELTGEWTNHVDLGAWADLMVIAPLTANSLSKMTTGLCDNLLLATYLSAKCPVMVAPAMDLDMYAHPATTRNLSTLASDGVTVIPADSGELASGLEGQGRLPEPEVLEKHVLAFFEKKTEVGPLKNKKVVITAGPTQEPIDPVRFITNHSSGKMGVAIANAAVALGAEVIFIHGPIQVPIPRNTQAIPIITAEDMFQAVQDHRDADIIIAAAAVADFSPKKVADQKIKKKDKDLTLELQRTTDILADLGAKKGKNQVLVGFALETSNEAENAQKKLKNKNLDFIVLNSLQDKGAGFGVDTNTITIYDKRGNVRKFENKAKVQVAEDILDYLIEYIHA